MRLTDFLDKGLSAFLNVDRDTAARFGINERGVREGLLELSHESAVLGIELLGEQAEVIPSPDEFFKYFSASLRQPVTARWQEPTRQESTEPSGA